MISSFQRRHIGPGPVETEAMLNQIGVSSLDQLVNQTIPDAIRLPKPLALEDGISEAEFAEHIAGLASKNQLFKNFIGQGYYGTHTPPPIRRNILENPGWYTAYTPYQAEISQGRLECLLNFQTMVCDLTGMPIANASLLDESTAAAEAALMLFHSRSREQVKADAKKLLVDEHCFFQTIAVVEGKCKAVGIEVVVGDASTWQPSSDFFAALIQYPNREGAISDHSQWVANAAAVGVKTIVATDLLALCLLVPPGEWGADVVVGNSQRFGVPMGYGGPHAGFFATREEFKRQIPGRIIGVSVDAQGKQALRMALQTREQHIRRDKATSNICTAQALLAIMASMYAVYHGPDGLQAISQSVHTKALKLAAALSGLGLKPIHSQFFDTVAVALPAQLKTLAEQHQVNFNYTSGYVSVSVDECTTDADLSLVISLFEQATGQKITSTSPSENLGNLQRTSAYLTHPKFSSYHSETELMRYIKSLENKDISLTRSMISLGSCTMKLNAAAELYPITMAGFANLHPFAPANQCTGYFEAIQWLHNTLCTITGFHAVSFQPNSGAQGEYAGLMVIRAYHESRGEGHRNVVLIPSSAHGTNPASAVVAGLQVVVVACDEQGNIDVADLRSKAEQHSQQLAALMVTYPSTHGVFEASIMEVTNVVHEYGGQVYMDGANMNAQVGLTNPATIGADVCHLNLHKTFAIPHGGGGPGVGPIGVAAHLSPFLPSHPLLNVGGAKAINAVAGAPFGSALILLISYAYCRMLGGRGVCDATRYAILNANYLKAKLEGHFPVLYQGRHGRVAHEMILDCRPFKRSAQVEVTDIAKRLMDFGYHAPTVSFPVAGTLMVEPTESESKHELDRFAEALIAIRAEIAELEQNGAAVEDSALHHAPHTAETLLADEWNRSYSRQKAAFPLPWVSENKYWVPVSRIDDAYGDRNLVCACPPIEEYAI